MKKSKVNMVLMVAFGLLFFTGLSAQSKRTYSVNDIQNLVNAVTSENDGLKRSGIYLAGFYKVKELCPVLVESFTAETEKNKILIALSLYQIQEENSMSKLTELSGKEKNPEVRRICNAIVEQYQKDNSFASR